MNNTPHRRLSMSLVLGAVCPTYWPTSRRGGSDHMTFSQIAEAVEDLRHPLRHGGLAGARASSERPMQARAVLGSSSCWRAWSTSSRAAISRMRVFTGVGPISS